jgi:hypothetical protein
MQREDQYKGHSSGIFSRLSGVVQYYHPGDWQTIWNEGNGEMEANLEMRPSTRARKRILGKKPGLRELSRAQEGLRTYTGLAAGISSTQTVELLPTDMFLQKSIQSPM